MFVGFYSVETTKRNVPMYINHSVGGRNVQSICRQLIIEAEYLDFKMKLHEYILASSCDVGNFRSHIPPVETRTHWNKCTVLSNPSLLVYTLYGSE